ncbi:MAG: PKD domain-containing protein, partial [Flavobacteriales bacterium]
MNYLLALLTVAGFSSICLAQTPCDSLLQASFTPQHVEGNSYLFNNSSNTASPPNTLYYWSFGDGAAQSGSTGMHTYGQTGTHTVCLYAFMGGCVDTTCQELQVGGDVPECNAEFQFEASQQHADSIHFNADQNGADHHYWHFGDGTIADNNDPWHVYAGPGTYVACLTVTNEVDGQSCTDTWCDTVLVTGGDVPECNAEFQFEASQQHADSIHFNAIQTGADHYYWHFGDGTIADNNDPWHVYAGPGTYVACLTVTNEVDGQSCTDTWCDTVLVTGGDVPECNAEFQFEASQQHADSIHFNAVQNGADHYYWQFGDGSIADNQDPWHVYAGPGTYVACLT